MAQKIIKFDCWSVKRRVARNKELQGGGEDEQCQQVVNFTGCEISQVVKFRRLRKFSQPEKFSGKF